MQPYLTVHLPKSAPWTATLPALHRPLSSPSLHTLVHNTQQALRGRAGAFCVTTSLNSVIYDHVTAALTAKPKKTAGCGVSYRHTPAFFPHFPATGTSPAFWGFSDQNASVDSGSGSCLGGVLVNDSRCNACLTSSSSC